MKTELLRSAARLTEKPTPKKHRPIEEEATLSSASETTEEQKYGNIPPQHVRAQRERAMRKGYEDMLSTDPSTDQTRFLTRMIFRI